MAIDYIVDYSCVPKQTLGTEGILERIKERERAQNVIRIYREAGDERPLSEIGFELTRNLPDGTSDTQLIIVQNALDNAAELDPLAHHCEGCPANAAKSPFGCMNFIQYPISAAAERWLIDQLPPPELPLLWLLLRQGVQEMGYTGDTVRSLRANPVYFEERRVIGRDMVEFLFTADQVFEMLFLLGNIQPAHAGMMLLFFNAVPRAVEADVIVKIMNKQLTREEIEAKFPFQMQVEEVDDPTVAEIKRFFYALWCAWRLNVQVILDV